MTTAITRYFESPQEARAAEFELVNRLRLSAKIVHVFDETDGLVDTLTASHVTQDTAKAYATRMTKGGAVMLVLAGSKPLGVDRITREVTSEMGAVDMGDLVQEVIFKEAKRPGLSIFQDHRHILLRRKSPNRTTFHMADWPIPLISRRKPSDLTLIPRHGRMANFPIPLISRRKPYTGSIFSRHQRMANFPIPLISKRKPYTGSMIKPHARMANFPIPLISHRKPYTGTVIGRHQRMANWPFPLLINGETGTNSLMPGGPRMANFPMGLLSDREPYDAFAFPRHARMANFPIPLLSDRKPYSGSAIPRHGRMADMILPLIIRRENTDDEDGKRGFSFSRMLGLRTVIRR